jgi:hypothetical protein
VKAKAKGKSENQGKGTGKAGYRAGAPTGDPYPETRPFSRLLPFPFAFCLGFHLVFTSFASVFAKNGDDALNYYGLITLSDESVGQKLAGRFQGQGPAGLFGA